MAVPPRLIDHHADQTSRHTHAEATAVLPRAGTELCQDCGRAVQNDAGLARRLWTVPPEIRGLQSPGCAPQRSRAAPAVPVRACHCASLSGGCAAAAGRCARAAGAQARQAFSWWACPTGSTWMVEWSMEKCVDRQSWSRARRRPLSARAESSTTTWAESTGMPEVMVHA